MSGGSSSGWRAGYVLAAVTAILSTTNASACRARHDLDAARAELAPLGRLRVALSYRNPVYVTYDDGREMRGVAVDLGRGLADALGAPFEPVRFSNIQHLAALANDGAWDVAFVGLEADRAEQWDYAGVYAEVEYTYLVRASSTVTSVADVDRAGVRVAVARGGMADAPLSGTLAQATLQRLDEINESTVDQLARGDLDAVVWTRMALEGYARNRPDLRVLGGTVYRAPLALAVTKERPQGLRFVSDFVRESLARGTVAAAISRAEVRGVSAPAAGPR